MTKNSPGSLKTSPLGKKSLIILHFVSFVRKIDVVNYRAERRVKLIQDYVVWYRNEKDLQDLLLVVDHERSKVNNLNKVLLIISFLFLKVMTFYYA